MEEVDNSNRDPTVLRFSGSLLLENWDEIYKVTGQRRTDRVYFMMLIIVVVASIAAFTILIGMQNSVVPLILLTLLSMFLSTTYLVLLLLVKSSDRKNLVAAALNKTNWFSTMGWEITEQELRCEARRENEHHRSILKWNGLSHSVYTDSVVQLQFAESHFTLARHMAAEPADWERLNEILLRTEERLKNKQNFG